MNTTTMAELLPSYSTSGACVQTPRLSLLLLGAAVSALLATTSHAGDPTSIGDVVGRDLQMSGLGWVGHVGVFDGSRVMEVLNEATVIQKNSLSNFKGRSSFWGARYIPSSYQFSKVIDTGWRQRDYSPKYTTSASYTVGGYQQTVVWNVWRGRFETKTVLRPAVFRCDTFTYYAFSSGIGYDLARSTILPRTVFNNTPRAR